MKKIHTHRVAVIGYIVKNDRFLLLKRRRAPQVWTPPGGHLLPDENPKTGLIREIKEETNLNVEIITPVDTWFDRWDSYFLLSIDYLVHIIDGDLKISAEHSDYVWVTINELEKGEPVQLQPGAGFHLNDFQKAWLIHQLFVKNNPSV